MNENVSVLLESMSRELRELLLKQGIEQPLMVGIHTGGIWLAKQLHNTLKLTEPLGTLDISFYRDDFSRIGIHPKVKPSKLPFNIDDRHLILVDDVLYTGRTVRAALNEIFDFGRPASVILVVLIDRSGRELPIQADVRGKHLELQESQQVKLSGPEPLELKVIDAPASERQSNHGT